MSKEPLTPREAAWLTLCEEPTDEHAAAYLAAKAAEENQP